MHPDGKTSLVQVVTVENRSHFLPFPDFCALERSVTFRTEVMGIFIDPDSLPDDAGGFVQLMFLTAVYAYILFR